MKKKKTTREESERRAREPETRLKDETGGRRGEATELERRQLLTIFDGIDEPVYISAPDTYEVLYANRALKDAFGEVVGQKCYRAFQSLDSPCDFCSNKHIFGENQGKTHIWEFQNKINQHWYRCIDRAIEWPDGRHVRCEIAVDITERKQMEEELKKHREQFEELVEERTGELIDVNRALQREIAERKAAEQNVLKRLELEKIILNMSSNFVGATDIDEAINSSLADMGELCGASRAYVYLFKENQALAEIRYEWCAEGISPIRGQIQDLATAQFSWGMSKLRDGDVIEIKSVSDLPPEAIKTKEFMKEFDTESALGLPLHVGKELVGFIGFGGQAETGKWDDYDLSVLRICSEIIGNALERKRAEEALSESEERYRSLVETMNEGFGMLDENGLLTYVNDRFCEMFGYSRTELLGNHVADFLLESDRKTLYEQLEKRKKGGAEPYELTWSSKNGLKVSTIISPKPIFDPDGRFKGGFAVITDITERRRMEEERDRALKERERVMETVPDVIYALDLKGYVVSWNRITEEITGYSHEEIGRMHALEFFAEKDRPKVANAIREVYEKGRADVEADFLTKDRRKIPYSFSGRTLTNEKGDVIGITGVGKDIADLRRAEAEKEALREQLLQSQKMESIGTLAGGMAHDFNNTLAIIMGSAETALRMLPENDPNLKRINKILDASRRAKDLSMKLLTFTRKEKLNVEIVSINAIIKDLLDILKRGISKDVKIKTRLSKNISNAGVDINQIQQAMLNICINAADAMPEGGLLTIETSETALTEKGCNGRPGLEPGKYCIVQISDTGPGIPDNIINKIFEPFFTTKERGKGTGLGLSITHGIIRSHSGHIDASSGDGEGTTMKIYLPATDEAPAHKEDKPLKATTKGTETILIVDDDPDLVDMAVEALEIEGYTPLGATSGKQAVELYEKHRGEIGLVILDIVMPEMDGGDVFRELKKIDPDVNVILCSGYADEAQAKELLDEGAKEFIQKPFDLDDILVGARKTLDGKSM